MTDQSADSVSNGHYILAELPENYELYEHRRVPASRPKSKANGLDGEKSTGDEKKERTDCFLYGYPDGPRKRFRSPAEFFPHLLWLQTDETGDRDNCSCKLCASDELQALYAKNVNSQWPYMTEEQRNEAKDERQKVPVKKGDKSSSTSKKVEPLPKTSSQRPLPQVVVPKRSNSANEEKILQVSPLDSKQKSKASTPVPTAQKPQQQLSLRPQGTNLPVPISQDQDLDAQCDKYLYRSGELVWFKRLNAWGICVILNRTLSKDLRHQDRQEYLIQPLSHPYSHPPVEKVDDVKQLCPWLAWSPPGTTYVELQRGGITYETVDWRRVLDGQFGTGGDAEVDGSILAARAIDQSYTLVEPLPVPSAVPSYRLFAGIFAGAEKIWIGEAIRIQEDRNMSIEANDIMILHRIAESVQRSNPSVADVTLTGDVYKFRTIAFENNKVPASNPNLPQRLTKDLEYRNRSTMVHKKEVSYWLLHKQTHIISLNQVRGRWYESRVVLPIITSPANFAVAYGQGDISHVGSHMNSRGDCNLPLNPSRTAYKKNDRIQAFGASVPAGTQLGMSFPRSHSRPLDPALSSTGNQHSLGSLSNQRSHLANSALPDVPMPMDLDINDAHQQAQQSAHGASTADLSEFLDVDRMDEGFGTTTYNHGYVENTASGNYQ